MFSTECLHPVDIPDDPDENSTRRNLQIFMRIAKVHNNSSDNENAGIMKFLQGQPDTDARGRLQTTRR
jgi:hypothetical protein